MAHPATLPPDIPLIAVAGPTASGKSELAVVLAEALGGEVINTDAMQVYRHLDIGTAKPEAALRERAPHHLIDVVEPDEPYSAGHYVRDAGDIIRRLHAQGRTAILCGGTGLYFRALLQGIAALPAVPEAVRERVTAELAQRGVAACHEALRQVDPETAARVHPNDPSRVQRALEVFYAAGRPLSAYHREQPFGELPPQVLMLGHAWERPVLYERINSRVQAMLDAGWIDEVRGLLARGYDPTLKPLRAIGYREIVALLRDERDEAHLARDIAQRTRHYAKRQLTWFRRMPGMVWAPPTDTATLLTQARAFLRQTPSPE